MTCTGCGHPTTGRVCEACGRSHHIERKSEIPDPPIWQVILLTVATMGPFYTIAAWVIGKLLGVLK